MSMCAKLPTLQFHIPCDDEEEDVNENEDDWPGSCLADLYACAWRMPAAPAAPILNDDTEDASFAAVPNT